MGGLRNFRAIDFARMGEGEEPALGDNPLPLSRLPKPEKEEPKRAARAPKAQPKDEPEKHHGDSSDLILP